MIKIILNGEEKKMDNNITILALLEQYNLDPKIIIIELNEMIIEKKNYDTIHLKDEDKLELIRLVGGG